MKVHFDEVHKAHLIVMGQKLFPNLSGSDVALRVDKASKGFLKYILDFVNDDGELTIKNTKGDTEVLKLF
ncbi:hypothetical protein ACFLZC_01065 [Patescibacteria group bacterium]